jgi:hypothetical protein
MPTSLTNSVSFNDCLKDNKYTHPEMGPDFFCKSIKADLGYNPALNYAMKNGVDYLHLSPEDKKYVDDHQQNSTASSKDLTLSSKNPTVSSKDLTLSSKNPTVSSKDLTVSSKRFLDMRAKGTKGFGSE